MCSLYRMLSAKCTYLQLAVDTKLLKYSEYPYTLLIRSVDIKLTPHKTQVAIF